MAGVDDDLLAAIAERSAPQNQPQAVSNDGSAPATPGVGGNSSDDILKAISEREAAANNPPPPPAPESLGRAAGLTARGGIEGSVSGIAGLPALAIDYPLWVNNDGAPWRGAFWKWLNDKLGTNFSTEPTKPFATQAVGETGDWLADKAGTPQPATPGENLYVQGVAGATAALAPGGLMRAGGMLAPQSLLRTGIDAASGASAGYAGEKIGQNGGTPTEQMVASILAGSAPGALARVGPRLITPLPSRLSPRGLELAKFFKSKGGNVSAGQITGSTWLMNREDMASKRDWGESVFDNPQGNAQQLTPMALAYAKLGRESVASPEVLDKQHTSLGARIGNLTNPYMLALDPGYQSDVDSMWRTYGRGLPAQRDPRVMAYLDQINPSVSSRMTQVMGQGPGAATRNPMVTAGTLPGYVAGPEYQRIRSDLTTEIRGLNGPDADKRYQTALIGIRDALDNAMDRSMRASGPAGVRNADLLKKTRQEFANLNVIEDAIGRSGAAGSQGYVTGPGLNGAMAAAVGRKQLARGAGQMNNLAHAGNLFARDMKSSATAERSQKGLLTRAAAGFITANEAGRPGLAIPAAGVAAVAPAIPAVVLNNPITQAYLGNQMFPHVGPTASWPAAITRSLPTATDMMVKQLQQ